MRKILSLLAGVIIVISGMGLYQYSPILSGASGYSAKNLCSGHFVSGFSGDTIMQEALIGASPILGNVSYNIDRENHRVDAHLFGFFRRRAVLAGDETGCTLLTAGQDSLHRPVVSRAEAPEPSEFHGGIAGADEQIAFDAVLKAAFAEPVGETPRNTKAVVILHKGRIVAERYADGVSEETPLLSWSMAKGITGLTAGLMVGDGLIDPAAPAPVAAWNETPDDPRANVTLDQLLRMSSGLAFNETYSTGSDVTYMLSNAGDAGGYAASLPLEADPDTKWSYSSGTSNIVSGILKNAAGGTLQNHYDYINTRLFSPLGITSGIMETDADGTFIGSSYSYQTARDWARLGQFCLQNGAWNGQQLLPENWITYVTTPTHTHPGNNYGAHFWLNRAPEDGSERAWPSLPEDTFFFSGFQGQFVAIVPSEELVVVRLGFTWRENHGAEDLIAGAIQLTSGL